jgi:hypothetical protein
MSHSDLAINEQQKAEEQMYLSNVICNVKDWVVTVHEGSDEPIRIGFGKHSETGVHMNRDEALDLMSQLEKAIHKTGESNDQTNL